MLRSVIATAVGAVYSVKAVASSLNVTHLPPAALLVARRQKEFARQLQHIKARPGDAPLPAATAQEVQEVVEKGSPLIKALLAPPPGTANSNTTAAGATAGAGAGAAAAGEQSSGSLLHRLGNHIGWRDDSDADDVATVQAAATAAADADAANNSTGHFMSGMLPKSWPWSQHSSSADSSAQEAAAAIDAAAAVNTTATNSDAAAAASTDSGFLSKLWPGRKHDSDAAAAATADNNTIVTNALDAAAADTDTATAAGDSAGHRSFMSKLWPGSRASDSSASNSNSSSNDAEAEAAAVAAGVDSSTDSSTGRGMLSRLWPIHKSASHHDGTAAMTAENATASAVAAGKSTLHTDYSGDFYVGRRLWPFSKHHDPDATGSSVPPAAADTAAAANTTATTAATSGAGTDATEAEQSSGSLLSRLRLPWDSQAQSQPQAQPTAA
eukprot:1548-Heterococcus_DN1.PRE.2